MGRVLQWLHPNTDWFLLHTYSDWQHETGTGATVASPKHRLISLAYIQWLATPEQDGCYSGFTQTQIDFSCIHTVTSNTRAGRVLQWLHPNTDWFLLHTYSDWQHKVGRVLQWLHPNTDWFLLHTYSDWQHESGTGVTVASPKHRLISLAYIQWLATREWDGCYSGFTQTQIDFSCIHTVTGNRRVGRVLQWLHPNTDWFLLHTYSDWQHESGTGVTVASPKHRLISLAYIQWLATRSGTGVTVASPKHRLISLAYIQWLATREWDGCYSGFTQTQIDFSCIHTVTSNTRVGRVLQWLHPNTDWFLLHTYSDWQHESGTGVTVASPKHRLISLAYIQWLATRERDGCYSGFTQTQIDFSCIHTVTSNTRAGRVLQWLHPNTDWFLLHTYSD